MRVLVTGATGFIGKALCAQLRALGWEVVPFTRKDFADLRSASAASQIVDHKLQRLDGVFHLAGIAHTSIAASDEQIYRAINVDNTRQLLARLSETGCPRFVYFSSVQAAGESIDITIDETWDMAPRSAYGQSKKAAEELIRSYHNDIPHVCILRPCLVYGLGQRGNLNQLLQRLAERKWMLLPRVVGSRSMVGVEDCIDAAILCMTNPMANNQVYILEGGAYSVLDIVRRALEFLDSKKLAVLPNGLMLILARLADAGSVVFRRQLPFGREVYRKLSSQSLYRSAKIRRELGWRPRQNLFDLLPTVMQSLTDNQKT